MIPDPPQVCQSYQPTGHHQKVGRASIIRGLLPNSELDVPRSAAVPLARSDRCLAETLVASLREDRLSEMLLEPVVGIRLVVEGLHLPIPGVPIEGDCLDKRSVGLEA